MTTITPSLSILRFGMALHWGPPEAGSRFETAPVQWEILPAARNSHGNFVVSPVPAMQATGRHARKVTRLMDLLTGQAPARDAKVPTVIVSGLYNSLTKEQKQFFHDGDPSPKTLRAINSPWHRRTVSIASLRHLVSLRAGDDVNAREEVARRAVQNAMRVRHPRGAKR